MTRASSGHSDRGLLGLLKNPTLYAYFQRAVGDGRARELFVSRFIRPEPGSRFLDIGCGPADLLAYLPDTFVEYVGFDMNPQYIDKARERWAHDDRVSFFCQRVEEASLPARSHFDVVVATAIVHHLDDRSADQLFDLASHALRDNGRLLTWDCVYTADQSAAARWLISRDRGKAVRTVDAYSRLASRHFSQVECEVVHGSLRIPYTILAMQCSGADPGAGC